MFESIQYQDAGRSFLAWLVTPDDRPARGGVLVFHGGSGLTDHEREQAALLADLGFVALAPDLFGETFVDRAHGMRVIGELVTQPRVLRARTQAALLTLHSVLLPAAKLAALGHCFGGLAALELARSGAELCAAISFHGRLAALEPARAGVLRGRVLACCGADDPFCPPEQRAAFEAEMAAAGVDWQLHVYGGARHGFTQIGIDPRTHPGCAYHRRAAERSWRAAIELLDEVITTP
jgi:dienelactone hydrolase